MALHSQGHGDLRRRRVLLDSTSSHDEVDQRPQSSPRRRRRTYADEALKENQHRLCDLIPKAWWTILLFLLLVPGGMLFGIVQGYQHFHQQENAVAAPFALTGSGNLASWFASLLLLSAVVGSLQVYLLRRHKLDDYRGRYRIWLVVAAWAAIASLDASSGLHRLLELVARRLPSSGILASADGWWLLIASGLTGLLGLRLLDGLDLSQASSVAGADLAKKFQAPIQECIDLGLLEQDGDCLKLTESSYLIANQAFTRFLE